MCSSDLIAVQRQSHVQDRGRADLAGELQRGHRVKGMEVVPAAVVGRSGARARDDRPVLSDRSQRDGDGHGHVGKGMVELLHLGVDADRESPVPDPCGRIQILLVELDAPFGIPVEPEV